MEKADYMAVAEKQMALAVVPPETTTPDAAAHARAMLKCYGVPKRQRSLMGQLRETGALVAARQWFELEGRWGLALSGPVGVGKTIAAAWWLVMQTQGETPNQKLKPRWLPATELAAADYYGAEFKDWLTVKQLVIDDLGTEFLDAKGMLESKVDRIMDHRYNELRPTLITTNLNAAKFAKRYGQRVVDRLKPGEGGLWAEFSGESLR